MYGGISSCGSFTRTVPAWRCDSSLTLLIWLTAVRILKRSLIPVMTVWCAHVTGFNWGKINDLLLKELLNNRAVHLHKA